MSGLHWTIPNGTSAPGKVLPPPVVQVRVSTIWARFEDATGAAILAWLRAALGSFEAGSGFGHAFTRPAALVRQTAICVVFPRYIAGFRRSRRR